MTAFVKGSAVVRAARYAFARVQPQLQHIQPCPFVFQPSRFISGGTRIFVGGIGMETREDVLREAFSSFGEVLEAQIVMDAESGKSKGYAFVRFSSMRDAKAALRTMDGRALFGKTIRVGWPHERPPVLGGSYGVSRYSDGGDYGN